MWPYAGSKPSRTLELSVNNPYSITPNGAELNKEYFNRINKPVNKFSYLSSYKLEHDGRVVKNHGVGPRDVTNEICTWNGMAGRKVRPRDNTPSKQLHIRNVTQLKVALDTPDMPLSHITGAIIRNEVAPTLTQLQNVDFVRANMSSEPLLPPMRRKSLDKARELEITTTKAQQRRPSINRHVAKFQRESIHISLPTLGNSASKENTKPSDLSPYQTVPALRDDTRKRSVGHLYGFDSRQSNTPRAEGHHSEDKVYETAIATGLRRDSVGKLTNEISDQFKHIMMMSKTRAEETDRSQAKHFAGNVTHTEVKTIPNYTPSACASYKRRHDYGKNLERNWFKSFVQKGKKKPSCSKPSMNENAYDMRLDIFYSPEPEPDDEYEETSDGDDDDDASMQCGAYSTATQEHRYRHSARTNSLTGDIQTDYDNNTDDGFSSGSDIEIILKDDQLIQRRTKHKLRKKRKRQMERYKAFMPAQMETVKEGHEEAEVTLTDQEIRAIRLNLRNKERMKKLKGKRRFLQAANAVYIAVQFRNILQKIRKRKLKELRRKQMKIAAMMAKRAQLKERLNDTSGSTPKARLKDVFMTTIGEELIRDVQRLRLLHDVHEEEEGEQRDDAQTQAGQERNTTDKHVSQPRTISRYERELRRVSMKDIEVAFPSHRGLATWARNRRNSIPVSVKPAEFIMEIQPKIKRRSKSKQLDLRHLKRAPSPPVRKCQCLRHKALEQALRSSHDLSCQHQTEQRKPKPKIITVPTSGLMRTYSLDDLRKKEPIELRDLLHDIDIPAKDVKLEILARKFRRQRMKRQQIHLDPYEYTSEGTDRKSDDNSDSDTGSEGSDDTDSDYDFIYGAPFVGSGVMWNQSTKDKKPRVYTKEEVDRELKRITRVFTDMQDCRYLRLDGLNQAILGRLRENSF